MCGIGGVLTSKTSSGWASAGAAILSSLQHRGPDDHGWLSYSNDEIRNGQQRPDDNPLQVLLLHRRLSILDLSESGRQPMSTTDGRFHITFNGEIYNYRELRTELESLGHCFQSSSDTEVLLSAWKQWGTECLRRLIGMFAFAVLDVERRVVTLARDFFGIKPLFYSRTPECFAFASEIKALLRVPGVSRKVNPKALHNFLWHGTDDHTPETMFADVQQLAPAHYMEVPIDDPAPATPTQFWSPGTERKCDLSYEEATERLRELFLESIELHLRSDVPFGTALSGGIDSSAVVGSVRHLLGDGIGFHSFSFIAKGSPLDEERWVDIAATAAATDVHKVEIAAAELAQDLDAIIVAQDEPFSTTSICAQFRVFRLAQEAGVKVLLDGQGADELLGGYPAFLKARLSSILRQGRLLYARQFARCSSELLGIEPARLLRSEYARLLPNGIIQSARGLLNRPGHVASSNWLNHEWFSNRGVSIANNSLHEGHDSLSEALIHSVQKSPLPSLLRFEDRNSMHFSIESRVPFLNPRIAEFLFSVPEEYIIGRDATTKRLFRSAMRGITPDAILNRRDKIGFATPERTWLQHIRPWTNSVINSDTAKQIPVLNRSEVVRGIDQMFSGQSEVNLPVWRWLNLIRWSECLDVEYA